MVVVTRAQTRKEKEVIKARFRFVLDDSEECRPEKILLRCIVPLPDYNPEFDGWMGYLPQHRESCYEGVYRFSQGALFWPMKRWPYGFTKNAYHMHEFKKKQLTCLWQNKFHFR